MKCYDGLATLAQVVEQAQRLSPLAQLAAYWRAQGLRPFAEELEAAIADEKREQRMAATGERIGARGLRHFRVDQVLVQRVREAKGLED